MTSAEDDPLVISKTERVTNPASPAGESSERDQPADLLSELGLLALGSRLRRVSDRIMSSGIEIYRNHHLDFEPRWFPVFRYLADHEAAAVGEIAKGIGFTHASVSQTATQMQKRGVLSITKGKDDERRRILRLTSTGKEMLPDLRELWEDIQSAAREVVDHSGVCVLTALDGIEDALDRESLEDRTERRRRTRAKGKVEIIDFESQLAGAFKDLNLEWLEHYFRVEPCDRVMLDHPEREIIDRGGYILFARLDQEVVGCVGLVPHNTDPTERPDIDADESPEELELIKMAVTHRHRGKQIGNRLMEAAIDRAKEVGARSLVLETNSSLKPAITLYRKAGFHVTGSGPSTTYERGDLFMRLDLEPS